MDQRVVVDDELVLVDLSMGRAGADVQAGRVLGDAVEAGQGLDVDEECRLGQPQLDERDQAVPA